MIRIAINGFGRIGRSLTRALQQHNNIEIVAINDLADAKTLAHLLKYDSVHGQFNGEISANENSISINGKAIQVLNEKDPKNLPWSALKIDIVIESTGLFLTKELASQHLIAGAKKVILSAPPKSDDIKTVVLGINDDNIDGTEEIISNASCTTNAVAPLIKVLHDLYHIESAYITTVHSYTSDQTLHDAPHRDLRRARAGAQSIIPTTTGAAKAITKIFPDLDIIMLTTYEEEEVILKALCAGACSFISKRAGLPAIAEAIEIVANGGSYMSPRIAKEIVKHFFSKPKQKSILF